MQRSWMVAVLVLAPAAAASAQAADSTTTHRQAAMDSAFAEARQLVISGQTAAGRHLADSIVAATPIGTPAYGAALYGRAQVAPTAADAERDYQRIIVEYPLSPHSGDALLQMAQLERSQGDRATAIGHLERYLRENPASPKRARTGFWLAQLLFEENDDTAACAVLDTARTALTPGDIELQNQMNFYTTRCEAAAARATADSTAKADSARVDSTARADSIKQAGARAHAPPAKAARSPRPPAAGKPRTGGAATAREYAVQVGAYGTAAEAQRAVDRLHERGIEARVDGSAKPFRVRIGHYKTRTEASRALAEFKKAGLDGFVAVIDGR